MAVLNERQEKIFQELTDRYLEIVGLTKYRKYYPKQLSTGIRRWRRFVEIFWKPTVFWRSAMSGEAGF